MDTGDRDRPLVKRTVVGRADDADTAARTQEAKVSVSHQDEVARRGGVPRRACIAVRHAELAFALTNAAENSVTRARALQLGQGGPVARDAGTHWVVRDPQAATAAENAWIAGTRPRVLD